MTTDHATRRIRCLAKLDSLLARYEGTGHMLRTLIAEQAWSKLPHLLEEAIRSLNIKRNEYL